jgi:hypothetical protein
LAINPVTSQTIYAGTSDNGIFKSTDGGGSWVPVNSGLTYTYILSLAIDPLTPQTIYAVTNGGVFKSTDGGGTPSTPSGSLWVTISPAGAVSAGAQWCVDGGSWQASGATVSGLTVGSHTVSFKAVPGWTPPLAGSVNITNGQTTSLTFTYAQQAPSKNGSCGSANGQGFLKAPTSNLLCSSGKASKVTGKGPWNWTCTGSNGATTQCSANLEINGACGSAKGKSYLTAPTTELCKDGTPSSVTNNGDWQWTCAGSNGGNTADCSGKLEVKGACGSANEESFFTEPTSDLCTAGTVSKVTGKGPWDWSCEGSNGGATARCSARLEVNGACGTANGESFLTEPRSNLCIAGKVSKVTGKGPWDWTCEGSNGGSTASCSANLK